MNNPRERRYKPIKLKQIGDDTSSTLLVGEAMSTTGHDPSNPSLLSRRTLWAYAYTSYNQSGAFEESRTLIPNYLKCKNTVGQGGSETCKRAWGSLHVSGLLQFLYCDGSVHPISPDVDMELFVNTATIANSEVRVLE